MVSRNKGGGITLFVPNSLSPKERKDLNYLNNESFESLWVECNNNNGTNKKKQLNNISYNPNESLINNFLEESSTSIGSAIVENKPITLMGDYNIEYPNPKEKECLETILFLYGLQIMNTEQPTRVKGNSQSLIDFINTDLPKSTCFETIVSDTVLKTLKTLK